MQLRERPLEMRDREVAERIKDAVERKEVTHQSLESAFKGLGFSPSGLGQEKKPGKASRKTTYLLTARRLLLEMKLVAHPQSLLLRLLRLIMHLRLQLMKWRQLTP